MTALFTAIRQHLPAMTAVSTILFVLIKVYKSHFLLENLIIVSSVTTMSITSVTKK
jgi:hypothetical protein